MKVYSGVTYQKDVTKAGKENSIGYVKIMNESDCQEKLNKWAKEYLVGWILSTNESIIFRIEDVATKTTMGYYTNKTIYSEKGIRRAHYVVLDTKLFTKYPDYLIESVLWHEFCHLWVRFECGVVIESQGKEFKNRQKTVLRYWIGDYISKFLWGLC